jgi:TfoX/Sxy family transcriptional regulator of competence genes
MQTVTMKHEWRVNSKIIWSVPRTYREWARASVHVSALCAGDTSIDYERTKNRVNAI